MKFAPRKPFDKTTIEDINVHGLTLKNIPTLEVNRKFLNKEHHFWYNTVVKAWCLSGQCGVDSYPICDANEYWLGVYDKPKKNNGVKIAVHFTCFSGMCGYTFDKFFDPKEIENEDDYKIQTMFIKRMNELIDEGVFIVPWEQDSLKKVRI